MRIILFAIADLIDSLLLKSSSKMLILSKLMLVGSELWYEKVLFAEKEVNSYRVVGGG